MNLAHIYIGLQKYKESLEIYKMLWSSQKMVLGYDHPQYLTIFYDISIVLFKIGLVKQSLYMSKKFKTVVKNKLGENHPYYSIALNITADMLIYLGEH